MSDEIYIVTDDWGDIIETVPLKRAKWVDTDPDTPDYSHRKSGMAYFCGECGHPAGKHKHKTYKYCPWCGAKMDLE